MRAAPGTLRAREGEDRYKFNKMNDKPSGKSNSKKWEIE